MKTLKGLKSLGERTVEWTKRNDKLTSKNVRIGAVRSNNSIAVANTKNGVKYKCTKIIEVWLDDKNQVKDIKAYFDELDNNLAKEIGVEIEPGGWLGYTNFKSAENDLDPIE